MNHRKSISQLLKAAPIQSRHTVSPLLWPFFDSAVVVIILKSSNCFQLLPVEEFCFNTEAGKDTALAVELSSSSCCSITRLFEPLILSRDVTVITRRIN